MNNTAFVTFVYPGVEHYLLDFVESLEKQSVHDFDLLVFNDGLSNPEKYFNKFKDRVKIIAVEGTLAQIRHYAFDLIKREGYQYVIFGDSDDYFSATRIETSLRLLCKADIVVNDLTIVTNDREVIVSSYLSNRILNLSMIDLDYISTKNIFGLSNTAVKMSNIPEVTIPVDLEVVDWYYFTVLMAEGLKAIFTNECHTYYRQHVDNIVGMKGFTLESINKAIVIKGRHYSKLKNHTAQFKKLSVSYDKYSKAIGRVGFSDEIINSIKNKYSPTYPLWWETPNLREIYENTINEEE